MRARILWGMENMWMSGGVDKPIWGVMWRRGELYTIVYNLVGVELNYTR